MHTSESGERATELLPAEQPGSVERAAEMLRAGELVAMPTETVYGLAANALNPEAVSCVFAAKGRPGWDPLIVHVCDSAMLQRVVRELPPEAEALMTAFWPGPLTLLLPRHPDLPSAVTAGRDLVAVRMPAHPVALSLIGAAGLPLAAPSANRFGGISPTTAEHVLADLDGRIQAVLDAGACSIGVESTVYDPAAGVLYRQGGVSSEELEQVAGKRVSIYQPAAEAVQPESLPSPGVGTRHYAPRARLLLVADEEELRRTLGDMDPRVTGAMVPSDWAFPKWSGRTFHWGPWENAAMLARSLYSGLRALDAEEIRTIVCPVPATSSNPLAEAVRDRLEKAARAR